MSRETSLHAYLKSHNIFNIPYFKYGSKVGAYYDFIISVLRAVATCRVTPDVVFCTGFERSLAGNACHYSRYPK